MSRILPVQRRGAVSRGVEDAVTGDRHRWVSILTALRLGMLCVVTLVSSACAAGIAHPGISLLILAAGPHLYIGRRPRSAGAWERRAFQHNRFKGSRQMNRRYMMQATFSSAMLLSIAGCLTAKLYQSFPPSEYDETATSFLVTEDGATCVVLGATYHYIFDITRSLRHVLMSSLRMVVNVQLSNFYVRRNNVVTGDYTLSLSENASDEQRQSAFDVGFATDNTPRPVLSGHLKGIRYSADGFPPIDRTHEFTRPYVVKIIGTGTRVETGRQNIANAHNRRS